MLDTAAKIWNFIEAQCTPFQYADRDFYEDTWNSLTSKCKQLKFPSKVITQGDKASYLGYKINHLRAQLKLLAVMK